jgi:hypothetical protein
MWIHKKLTLSVVLDQGQQKRLRKQRALLCKTSRDVDSRKLTLSVVLDQGLAKKAQETKGIVCKPDGYIRKLNLELVRNSLMETEGKRKTARKRIRRLEYGHKLYRQQRAYQVPLAPVPHTSHLAKLTVNRPPPPRCTPTLLAPRPTPPGFQRSTPRSGRGHF